ncbi:MAG: hypothetical protein IT458_12805 [Planctomycetes bacterium]|nr:hypothetical protein [Planctomycetota bacterium]
MRVGPPAGATPCAAAGGSIDPRALLLLGFVAAALWFPVQSWWQSDDFIALHYAQDLRRALSDFAGNQYGLEGMVWFYRPLVTLSFWLDAQLGGGDPFVAHLGNALVHGVDAVLVAVVANRALEPGAALRAGLVWALSPSHAGAVTWAVGRVDGHATAWILLATLCLLRWQEGRTRTRLPALACAALALGTKEVALVLPGIAAVLGFARGPAGSRVRAALAAAWPLAALVAGYLAWRYALFGRVLGGYEGTAPGAGATLVGLGVWVARLLDPFLLAPPGEHALLRWLLIGVGALPTVLAGRALARARRGGLVVVLGVLFLGACLPLVPFLAATGEVRNARYFYLPFAALAVAVAAAGRRVTILWLAAAALPWLGTWFTHQRAFAAARDHHIALRDHAATLDDGPLFVQGLPLQDETRSALLFHLGVDRLLQPPFAGGRHVVHALRPLDPRPGVFALGTPWLQEGSGEGTQGGLPFGRTLTLIRAKGRITALPVPPLQLPELVAHYEGPAILDGQALLDLHAGRAAAWLRFPGGAAPRYRLTLLTASGTLSAVVANEAPPGAPDGAVAVASLLTSRYADPAVGDAFVALALRQPATLDLDPAFPVLAEAGAGEGAEFRPRAANRTPLRLAFGRDYAEWAAGRVAPRPR